LIDTVAAEIQKREVGRVGILASPTTIRTGLYETALKRVGIQTLTLSSDEQLEVEGLIRRTIANEIVAPELLRPYVDELFAVGAQVVLLGCTELSVIMTASNDDRILDPLRLVANRLVTEV
jgi:aspartate racemase